MTSPFSTQSEEKQTEVSILVVDDFQENILLLEDVLREQGYLTLGAANGLQALQVLENNAVHLIIADAMMPKMDGFQLCKSVKRNTKTAHIPFIIYSSDYIDKEDKDLARTIGADRYVVKAGGTDSILQAVNEIITSTYALSQHQPSEHYITIDDHAFMEKHYKLLIKKLEEKMLNLEGYSLQLLKKNDELHSSERRYRLLFEKASIPIFVLDALGEHLIDLNKQAVDILGYTREELLERKTIPFADNDVMFTPKLVDSFNGEITVKTKEGKVLQLEANANLIDFDNAQRILLFALDVTERKAMVDKLFQTEKLSMLGTIAAGIAHEVRNPLAGIKLNLQFLEQKFGDAHSDIETVRLMIEGAKHIEKVIENTLNIARTTSPEMRTANINDVVLQSISLVALTFHKKNISLETNLDQDLPMVTIDSKQIMQVVLNILRNAIEATPSGGKIAVTTGFESPQNKISRVFVSIRDTGEGISKEYLRSTFELFKTTKSSGTGLGLALSHRIMQQHNGDITIVPVSEGGTEVLLFFQRNYSACP